MEKSSQEKLDLIKSRIIEQIAQNMKLYGVSETVGRVMATIYYHKRPMTLDELSQEIGMTKMSMSNAVRELIDLGVAEKIYVRGSRKDHYIIEQDYFQSFINTFSTNWKKSIQTKTMTRKKMNQELESIIANEDEADSIRKEAINLREENDRALEYFEWVSRLIDHFESHKIFDYIPKKEQE